MKKHKYYKIATLCFSIVCVVRLANNEIDSDESFDNINEERKQHLYNNIQHIIDNPNTTPEQEHKIWMELKIKDGWKYGEKTDRKNKIHNCLVTFEELNFYQRLKDELFIITVKKYFNL